MDIDILLALQEFRNGSGAFLASFFSKMTWLGELNTAIVIMALIYWCISKDIPRALRVVLGLLVLLVAFSRNYLGVHTPQDVLVGVVAAPWSCI